MSRAVTFLLTAALLCAAPAARKWHDAEVVSVKNVAIFRVYEIIDSYDPRCRLKYLEFRNPFKPLNVSEGLKVQIAEGNGPTVYLIDKAGRTHKGRLIVQTLMALPPPPPPDKTSK
jgi:hypothetical protein